MDIFGRCRVAGEGEVALEQGEDVVGARVVDRDPRAGWPTAGRLTSGGSATA